MIDNNDIRRLKELAKIDEVIANMGISVSRKGRKQVCLCPFHNDHNPSMIVNAEKGTFWCPVCGEKGDAISFVMKLNKMNYIEAVKEIAKMYNVQLNEVSDTQSAEQRKHQEFLEQIRLQREAIVSVSSSYLFQEGKMTYDYLRQRGLNDETLSAFHVGLLPNKSLWSDKAEMLHKSIDAHQLQNRIIIPWYSASNSIVGLSGRIVDERTKGIAQKYLNSSERTGFIKGNHLFGINLALQSIVKERKVYIVEGYTDVMAMHQSGVKNVVAQCGTALTDTQAKMIKRYADEVVLCLDNDAAGLVAMDRAAQKLLPLDLKVEILLAPEGCDPADLLHDKGEEAVKEWSQTQTINLLDMCLDNFRHIPVANPYMRRAALYKLLSYLKLISDDILRSLYIAKCIEVEPMLKEEILKQRLI